MGRYLSVGLLLVAAMLVGKAPAAELPRARPEELGFSSERLAYIDQFYSEKVAKGEMAGVVTLVARHGKIAHFSAVGYSNAETRQKIQTDTIFRYYSMTKPIASTALMILYQEGRFQMDEPIAKYLPEFTHLKVLRTPQSALDDVVPLDRPPTIQDVLRHTAGFTHGGDKNPFDAAYQKLSMLSSEMTLAEMMQRLSTLPLRHQPGTKWVYSVGPDVQARLVEVLSGMPFEEFLDQRLFKPLGMRDTAFRAPPDKAQRLMPAHWTKEGKLMLVNEANGHPDCATCEPASVNGYVLDRPRKGGSFGLVGTAGDYWRFAQMMANGGVLDGVRILSPEVVRYMGRDHLAGLGPRFQGGQSAGTGWGLGFAVMRDPVATGYVSSEGALSWHGAANTFFWIDPKKDLVVVAMTQELPTRLRLRSEMHALVYSALIEAGDHPLAPGTVEVPRFQIPLSRYLSEEAKAAFAKNRAGSTSRKPSIYIDEVRRRHDEALAPALRRMHELYPVEVVERRIAGVRTRVITPQGHAAAPRSDWVLLNLHGGGFYTGAESEALVESIPIASATGRTVITIDYRQGPEFQHPAASEDVVAVYSELLKSYPAMQIGIYGCSTGGSLSAMVVLSIAAKDLPRPGAIGIFSAGAFATSFASPLLKGSWGGDSRFWAPPLAGQAALNPDGTPPAMPQYMTSYLAGANLSDPSLSPAESPQVLATFPPTLLMTGTRAYDLSAVVETHRRLLRGGVEADMHLWDGLGHCFHFDPDLPESREAYKVTADFFGAHLGAR